MFSSHSLIQNALVNNDDALVNVIKQSLNLEFAKSKKVSQDYLLKSWFKKRKLLKILMQKTFVMVLLLEPEDQYFSCYNVSKSLFALFLAGKGLLNTLGTLL